MITAMSLNNNAPPDDLLIQRLRLCSRSDLEDLLKDLKLDPLKYKTVSDQELVLVISKELRSAAGHTVTNLFRHGHELSYRNILVAIADKLTPGVFSKSPYSKVEVSVSAVVIENHIQGQILDLIQKQRQKLNAEQRSELDAKLLQELQGKGVPEHVLRGVSSALATGALTGVMVAPVIATALFGGFWTWLIGMSLGQVILGGLAGGGPVGLVVAAAVVVGGPSHAKVIPAVVRLITIRQSRDAERDLL